MITIAIDSDYNIQILKNNNLIKFNNQKTSVFNNQISAFDIYNLSKINKVNIINDSSNALLYNINTQLGDLSTITNNNTLANIINNLLTQSTTLNIPIAPTNNILNVSISFNDVHLTQKTISGTLSWDIPNDLTNITHFEGYLSIDQNGTQRESNNIFIVNNTTNSITLNNVYIGLNLYILIYTKNMNAANIGVLQSTNPGYILIKDIYNIKIKSIDFVPTDSLTYNQINGTVSWVFETDNDDLFDGVNVYLSTGTLNTIKIGNQIVKTITNLTINEPFNIIQSYYILIYTYKIINNIVYESEIFEKIKIENKYKPTNIKQNSVYFDGGLNTTNQNISGTLIWEFELPKDSIDGVEIFLTDTGDIIGDTDILVAKTTDNSITSYSFQKLIAMRSPPGDPYITIETKQFILRTYNKHYINETTGSIIVEPL